MLGVLVLTAATLAGADASVCVKDADEAAFQRLVAQAEAELSIQQVYADAERDFAALDEVGLAGSTLAREQARVAANAPRSAEAAVAHNR
jgi:hypothetical protein